MLNYSRKYCFLIFLISFLWTNNYHSNFFTVKSNKIKKIFFCRRERLRWFFLLLIGTCLLYATRTSVPLAIPVISKEKLWDKTDSGIILSSFFWGYSLTQILSGYVSDRIGGHKVMCVAALGWSTTVFFMPNIIRYGISHHFSIHLVVLIRAFNGALQGTK